MRQWIFVQARLGSKRLPQKVLRNIGTKSVIEHLHERLQFLKGLMHGLEIAYLIPDNTANQPLEDAIKALPNCHVFKGSENNVLDRFANAAETFMPDRILRLTADCPFVDPFVLSRLIEIGDKDELDYCYLAPSYAEGVCADYFTSAALEMALNARHKLPEDIEHITPFFHRNKKILNILGIENHCDDSAFRIVLDSQNDFDMLVKLEEHLNKTPPPDKYNFDVIRNILLENSDLTIYNKSEIRNEKFDVFSIK
jgi:spore coat polysaccharide biosynthesis protein SpsF